jgi:endo-1,4-beta-xylanase
MGPSYIPLVFSTAAKAAKGTRTQLYYNDYNIEYPGPKSSAAQGIVKSIQAYGARIDGVGLQSHFVSGDTPTYADQKANVEAFTALGVKVA